MADVAGADAAQRYRVEMREKAEKMGRGEDAKDVDASSFEPAEKLYAGVKTGMRPVSRQARKSGGAVMGFHAGGSPARSPRKGGGNVGISYVNRDQKAANAEREGEYPNGGMKAGGRTGRAGGGYLPREGGPTATRDLKRKTGSSAVDTSDRPASEDGRLGRASGGRVGYQTGGMPSGGPLATPLAAGMGGQGRFNFNYGPQQSEGAKLGIKSGGYVGRERAHERYGASPGPVEHHPGMAKASGGRVGRASGGEVAKKALAAHHAEHNAMAKGRAKGGETISDVHRVPAFDTLKKEYLSQGYPEATAHRSALAGAKSMSAAQLQKHADGVPYPQFMMDDGPKKSVFKADGGRAGRTPPLDFSANQAAHDRRRVGMATESAMRMGRPFSLIDKRTPINQPRPKAEAAGGKAGHGPDCSCPRCAARKAKGGLLKEWDAKKRAEGGPVARARGGKAGKGKMNVNIVIAPGGMGGQQAPPPGPLGPVPPPPGGPMRPPGMPMPGAAPGGPPAPGMMPMPIPVPMGGAGGPPGAGPPPRKRGGRVRRAGSGSGLGRLDKIEKYGSSPPAGKTGV